MMLLAPIAAATPKHQTFVAPYTGVAYGYLDSYFSGCGGSMSETAAPVFNLTTGQSTFAYSAKQVSCGREANATETFAEIYVELYPVSLASGRLSIESNWKSTFAVKLAATSSSDSYAYAEFQVATYLNVYDATNYSFVTSTGTTSVSHAISSGTFSKTYSNLNGHAWVNATFNSTHTYYLEVAYEAYLYVETYAGSSSASASFSMASSKDLATLKSVVVS